MKRRLPLLLLLAVCGARTAHAKPEFLGVARSVLNFPKGGRIDQASCSLCHAASGPPAWNPFGNDLHKALKDRHAEMLTREVLLSVLSADSDHDGYTNAEEIAGDTLPGDPRSHPSAHKEVVAVSVGSDEPPNPFSPEAILLAKDAQHPALVHFPIALFIVSVALDLYGKWKKNPTFVAAALINLTLAGLSSVVTVISGILAWRLKFDGAPLTGNLLLHFIGGLTTTAVIWTLLVMRRKGKMGVAYFGLAMFGLLIVSATGHLGGVISGVAN